MAITSASPLDWLRTRSHTSPMPGRNVDGVKLATLGRGSISKPTWGERFSSVSGVLRRTVAPMSLPNASMAASPGISPTMTMGTPWVRALSSSFMSAGVSWKVPRLNQVTTPA